MNLFGIFVILALKSELLFAHMLMKSPPTRGYKNNPSYPAIDYDLNGPLPSLVNYFAIKLFIISFFRKCAKESHQVLLSKPGRQGKL